MGSSAALGQSLGSRMVVDKDDGMTGHVASGQSMAVNWIRSAEQGSGAELVNGVERGGAER